jgi:hypothetical protein
MVECLFKKVHVPGFKSKTKHDVILSEAMVVYVLSLGIGGCFCQKFIECVLKILQFIQLIFRAKENCKQILIPR